MSTSPKGVFFSIRLRARVGGNIKSAGATASVLGTTLIVGANQSGGFKVMLLEGKGQVTGAGGRKQVERWSNELCDAG